MHSITKYGKEPIQDAYQNTNTHTHTHTHTHTQVIIFFVVVQSLVPQSSNKHIHHENVIIQTICIRKRAEPPTEISLFQM